MASSGGTTDSNFLPTLSTFDIDRYLTHHNHVVTAPLCRPRLKDYGILCPRIGNVLHELLAVMAAKEKRRVNNQTTTAT